MVKLTKAQTDILESAALVSEWFTPYPPRYETAAVIGRVSTCKALCGKGLLEYRVYMEAVNRLPEILQFRITWAGYKWIEENLK